MVVVVDVVNSERHRSKIVGDADGTTRRHPATSRGMPGHVTSQSCCTDLILPLTRCFKLVHCELCSMSTSKAKSKSSKAKPAQLTAREIQQNYNRFQSDLQSLASKIGELEQEAEEHGLVLSTLDEALVQEPDRKCFRLVGGVLVERTVKDVVPALKTNQEGILKVISSLADQYKGKEEEFETFKRDYNIRPAAAA
ncbi:hypothetical protein AcV5_001342 [Taiwanofungus camphoratus]|nr:hypothetical protein AcV5_001342 [Antrodia cinnamomea]